MQATLAKLPSGGHWYATQQLMMAELVDGEFTVAWDKDESGAKCYGRFPDAEAFFSSLLAMEDRLGYELVLKNSPCKLYADIEWYGERDVDHKRLAWMLAEMRKQSQTLYNKPLEIYVCCSSRDAKGGKFKNSYHIVSPSLVYPSNRDIRSFFEALCVGEDWLDSERKSYVDLSVYSKNRCIRLPLCCKKGSSVCFARISGDPWDTKLDANFAPDDPESWLPFILTSPTLSPSPAVSISTTVRKKRSLSPRGESVTKRCHVESPIPSSKLNDALVSFGDEVSIVTNAKYVHDVWQIQCDQRKQRRPCLINTSRTHSSNNCLLFLKQVAYGTYKLDYHCTSCKGSNLYLGDFVLGPNDWGFQARGEEQTKVPDLPERNTYEVVKKRFEAKCMKVSDPFVYIRLQEQSNTRSLKPIQTKHSELLQYYVHLTFYAKDKKGVLTKMPFIQAWIKDPKKREVSSMVVDPQGTRTGVYNMWNGYLAMNVERCTIPEANVIAPIVRHLNEVITNGNHDHTEWLLDWMANIVQYPWRKSQVAVCLFGRQGCGKGIIFDWFREQVLGPDHSGQISNPERDLFSRFSDGFLNKTFLQIDEVKSLHDHTDKLKDLITNRTVNWEPKNGKMVTLDNICNFLFTTNNENALRIDNDDRRFVLFRCKHTGDRDYFHGLADHLHMPGVNAGFYDILRKRDLSKYTYDFQAQRPITEYYKESQQASVPPVKRYLSALINSKMDHAQPFINGLSMPAADLYSDFKKWCELEGYKHITANIAFGRELHRIEGVKSHKSHGKMLYDLDYRAIKECLSALGEYDENAFFHGKYI